MRDRSTMNAADSFNTGPHQGLRQGARAQDRCASAACMLDPSQVSPERARIAFRSSANESGRRHRAAPDKNSRAEQNRDYRDSREVVRDSEGHRSPLSSTNHPEQCKPRVVNSSRLSAALSTCRIHHPPSRTSSASIIRTGVRLFSPLASPHDIFGGSPQCSRGQAAASDPSHPSCRR